MKETLKLYVDREFYGGWLGFLMGTLVMLLATAIGIFMLNASNQYSKSVNYMGEKQLTNIEYNQIKNDYHTVMGYEPFTIKSVNNDGTLNVHFNIDSETLLNGFGTPNSNITPTILSFIFGIIFIGVFSSLYIWVIISMIQRR
jgi:hypothetical protein